MSYESEERYWTDYLRVALPVIGLLLMLALFWWWAQQFIGSDGDSGDVAQSTRTAEVATAPVLTPTATAEVQLTAAADTEAPTRDTSGASNDGTPSADTNTEDCGFAKGDTVQVTEDEVNLRSDPDASADNVVEQMNAGTLLSIVENCYVEDEAGNQFWRVRNQQTSKAGYVSADYIEASE